MRDAGGHFRAHAVGEGLALVVIARAQLGGDGEAGRHRQADPRHLREIRALAAEQVPVACAAIRNAAAAAVHILRHYLPSPRFVRRPIIRLVMLGICRCWSFSPRSWKNRRRCEPRREPAPAARADRKSTRPNSSNKCAPLIPSFPINKY